MDENVLPPGVSTRRRRRGCKGRNGPNTSPVGCGFRRERVTRVVRGDEGVLGKLALGSDGNVVGWISRGGVGSVCTSGGESSSVLVCGVGGRVGDGEDGGI